MIEHMGARSALLKITITACVGALTFPLTNLIFASISAQVAMSSGTGAVILIIQFLIEFERRLGSVEEQQHLSQKRMHAAIHEAFQKIDDATHLFRQIEDAGLKTDVMTRLVQNAAAIGPDPHPLISALVEAEIGRMSRLLRGISEGEVIHEGEDRDWMLALTGCVQERIDATSLTAVDAGAGEYDTGFWGTDLGQRYLRMQREAIRQRHVAVRRVFILEDGDTAETTSFQRMCRVQAEHGIEVRVLDPASVPSTLTSYLFDFILFDGVLSYEVTPATQVAKTAANAILHTRLVMETTKLTERIERYEELWKSAAPFMPA